MSFPFLFSFYQIELLLAAQTAKSYQRDSVRVRRNFCSCASASAWLYAQGTSTIGVGRDVMGSSGDAQVILGGRYLNSKLVEQP